MSDLLVLGGHGWYVWMSYAAVALVVIAETIAVRARHRRAVEAARTTPAPAAPPAARFDPAPPR